MAAWAGWEDTLLAALGMRDTADNQRFLDQWQSFEGGTATNNPLNTTQPWAGASNYNSVGVKNYKTQADGIQATATTLRNGRYDAILAALRTGNPYTYSEPLGVAQAIRTWGTGTFAEVYTQATGKPLPGTAATPNPSAVAPSGHRGYADMRNSLGRHLPTQLEQSRRLGAATLRTLARPRKVRG
jgi:hypothetical protein